MRKFATRNRYHFDSADAGVRKLQRSCIDVRSNFATYPDQSCLIDLRKSDFLDGLGDQNRPLRACIDKGIRRGEAELIWRSYEGVSYFDLQPGSVELQVSRIAAWRVISLHG